MSQSPVLEDLLGLLGGVEERLTRLERGFNAAFPIARESISDDAVGLEQLADVTRLKRYQAYNAVANWSGAGGSFTLTEKSLCIFIVNATGFVTVALTAITCSLTVDATANVAVARAYINEINSHNTLKPGWGVLTLDAGLHTTTLVRGGTNPNTDVNDSADIQVLAIPQQA